MLQDIRDNAQGTIAKVIVGLIIFTFALFGVDSIIGGLGGEPQVATVNGVEIAERDFTNSVERNRRQILNQMGDKADPALIDDHLLRKSVLESLISQTLKVEAAKKQGLHVSDSMVDEIIRGIKQFQVNGKFDNNQFISMVNGSGQSVKQFRASIKKDVLIGQSRDGLVGSEFSLSDEMLSLVELDRQTRDAAVLSFDKANYLSKVNVSDEQIKTYWEGHKNDYTQPSQVDINYILLDKNAIADAISVDDKEIQKLYQQELDNFVPAEERHAAHILIEVNDKVSKADALKEVDVLEKKLKGGADFTELAKSDSQDVGSSTSGGDLGFAGKGTFVPEFEKSLFELKVGEISKPVLTQYGYHIIKLLDIRKNDAPSIAELAPSLEASYKKAEAEKQYVDLSEQLSNISYTTSDLVEPSDELTLTITSAKAILKEGEVRNDFNNVKLIKALFSADAIKGDGNTDLIELSKDKSIVAHVTAFRASRILTFEEAKLKIKDKLTEEAASTLAAIEGAKILKSLLDNSLHETDMKALSWSEKKGVKRNDTVFSSKIMDQLFSMEKDAKVESVAYKGFKAENGDFVIIKLDSIVKGSVDEVKDDQKIALSRILASNTGAKYYQFYQDFLKSHAEIEKQ